MSVNFRQLEVFRAVAEAKSFTHASHALFISQSTVSQHIRELEDYLDIKLCDRNKRNVSLTPAGESLLQHCQHIFQMLREAETAAKTVTDPYCGKLAFGCASTTLLYHLPKILTDYTRRYPHVELNITGGTARNIGLQMWSGALDLALVVPPLSSQALEKIVLVEEPFVLVLPASHILAKKRTLRVGDLGEKRFILYRRGTNTRRLIDRYLFHERVMPQVAIELVETEAIKAMVACGLGVSVLPSSAFQSKPSDSNLKTFAIPRVALRRALAIVYPRARALRPPAIALVEMLKTYFKGRESAGK